MFNTSYTRILLVCYLCKLSNICFFSDCLITTAVNCFTSFFSGFVIFTYLGFMSHKQHKPISSVATEGEWWFWSLFGYLIYTTYLHITKHSNYRVFIFICICLGPGLVFQVYPEAVATLPGSNIWAMLFFFMSITLGIDSAVTFKYYTILYMQ